MVFGLKSQKRVRNERDEERNAFNWSLVSLAAKTKALLTRRRQSLKQKTADPQHAPPAEQWLGPPRRPTGRDRRCQLCPRLRTPRREPRPTQTKPSPGSGFKQKPRWIPNNLPRASTHARRKQRPTHEKKSQRSIRNRVNFTDFRTYKREFFHEMLRVTPTSRELRCCCSSFTVRGGRECPERAHKWGKGVSFHRSPSVIGWLAARWC